jgi:hypothetical protein
MTKHRKPTWSERMARAIRSFFEKPKLEIRFRSHRDSKRGEWGEYQVVHGREVVKRFPVTTNTLDDVRAAYPGATLAPSLAKRDED